MRLDVFLAKKYPEFTRGFWQRRIKEGKVKVNGKIIKRSHVKVKDSESIEVESPTTFSAKKVVGESHSFKVLYEDENFMVIDKPFGIAVHPPDNNPTITELISKSGQFAKPAHRLDKDTSGVLVIAKSEQAHAKLSSQWKNRKVKKTYLALVKGVFKTKKGIIEAPISRSTTDRKKMAVSGKSGGRDALTRFEIIKTLNDYSFVHVYPLTGRTHQIRVHFSSIDHPIIGDNLYGDKSLNKKFEQQFGLTRQFLHAEKLILTNPTTKKRITFTSKLPEDLKKTIDKVKCQSHRLNVKSLKIENGCSENS